MAGKRSEIVRRIAADTKDWILDASDDDAARAGAVMDLGAAAYVIDWIQGNCCFYEGGEYAGKPFLLMPYQIDFITRLFGWKIYDPDWKSWVRRFRHAALWCAKKNGKSPFLAAIGTYLLVADGEAGQKVYTAAKNGKQAKITQKHAFKMVEQSPALSPRWEGECRLHRGTMDIVHEPSESVMMILTGDDERGRAAQEGLNGSILVDEAHVFDWQMAETVERAGISRKQPLFLSVSTAGDDPSSWGYTRFRTGRQIARGERRNHPRYLHVEYCAPDGTTERDLDRNLDELGRAANPAWGVTVKPGEFRDDFNASRGNPREMAKFAQHRCNLWIGSVTRWLDQAGWARGERDYDLESLRGCECYVGIDLARRLDMAAVCLTFPWPDDGPEAVRLWPMFWFPLDVAQDQDKLFPFLSWAEDERNQLRLQPGNIINFNSIKNDLRRTVRDYELSVMGIYFDATYAEDFVQNLIEGEWGTTGEVEPGWGCEKNEVSQTMLALCRPSAEFERRVKSGNVVHPGNSVMSWQVGHCDVWRDNNNNVRPVKPDGASGKKIDGIVAAVMTFSAFAESQGLPRIM